MTMRDPQNNSRVYVARSPIHGKGLFAAHRLRAGDLIGRYEGPEVDEDGKYVLWIEKASGGEWTGYEGRNQLRYLNHADQPNAEMDGLRCFALTDIPAHTEITIDYGWNDS